MINKSPAIINRMLDVPVQLKDPYLISQETNAHIKMKNATSAFFFVKFTNFGPFLFSQF